jgi:nucleoredoxin
MASQYAMRLSNCLLSGRRPILACLTLWAMAIGAVAFGMGAAPLQMPEISLMLRASYSSAEVIQEIQSRRVIDPLDAAAEKNLLANGADPRLIAILKSGQYTLAPTDSAAAKRQLDQATARIQADRQANQAALLAPEPAATGPAVIGQHMANLLHGKLVTFSDGTLKSYDDEKLTGKKYFGLYHSAHWCGPCRKFTPELVNFYKQMTAAHPEFEIVFVSDDHSPLEMQQYMQLTGMPWAALRYENTAQEKELTHYFGNGIPDLVIVDGNGRVLSDSYHGHDYVGPNRVLNDFGKLLAAAH